ncbi:hypothetical protein ACER0C_030507 [Sarotherodon galilaeus]
MDGGSTPLFVLRVGSWFRFHIMYEEAHGLSGVLYGGREELAEIFLQRIMMMFLGNLRLEAEMDGHAGSTPLFVLRLGSFRFHLIYEEAHGLAGVLYGGREELAEIFLQRIMMMFLGNLRLEAEMDGHAGSTPLFVLRVGSWFRLLLIYEQTDGLAVILYGGREELAEIFLQRITMMFLGNPRRHQSLLDYYVK